jgi:Pentapeptide repeats (8 copies)
VQQEPKSRRQRAEDLISLLVPDWRPTPRQGLWAIRIGIVLGLLVAIGYSYGVTLWDWIKLLIVPAAIAGAGLWFNAQQREREQRIADNRAQHDSLQAYIDGMSQLLTETDREQPLHSARPGDSLSTLARARTLTLLARLDGARKRSVLEFLYESELILKSGLGYKSELRHNIVSLIAADLRGAFLGRTVLMAVDLRGAFLGDAVLFKADLSEADLSGANLSGANLSGAVLIGAQGWTEDQLSKARTLADATMPDGQILKCHDTPDGPTFEEWLKSQGRKENGKNDGSP